MLDILITMSYLILSLSFVVLPIILLRKMKEVKTKYIYLKFLCCVLIICFFLSVLCAFWKDYSSEILLRSYNAYELNLDSGTEQVEYKNVKAENLERVKQLEQTIMGIGWPLRAIFIFVFSILPVFFLTFLINEIIDTKIIKKRNIMKKVFK
jgi:hypothetical protein